MTEQQPVHRDYTVTRADGQPDAEGAKYFTVDTNADSHGRVAVAAYIRSIAPLYPKTAEELEAKHLGGGKKLIADPAPAPVTADVFKTSRYHERSVGYGDLYVVGLSDADIRRVLDARHSDASEAVMARRIPWARLVLKDGLLALTVLSVTERQALSNELRAQGINVPVQTAQEIGHVLWVAAEAYCPTDEWADRALQSSISAALLLKLAQASWAPVRLVEGR